MLSCVVTREVSCVLGPPEDDGEPAVDCEREGECLASREVLAPLGLAREDASRGLRLPADVTALERLPLRMPLTCAEPGGEMRELVEEVDDWRLVT